MNILRLNTSPTFQIVSRENIDVSRVLKFVMTNERTSTTQEVLADATALENENYQILMQSFPTGKIGDKIAYTLIDNLSENVVSLGKILIVSETESVQDYSKKENTKFYN